MLQVPPGPSVASALSTSVRTPKLSVTTSDVTVVTEPTGKPTGMTKKSFP